MSKKFTDISANVLLLSLLGLSCLDTAWSNTLPEESNWSCAIATMHKRKALPGDCYSYQQCQWNGIGDYDMEVIKCPTGRVFDESINECVTDKVLGFTFDKKLCDTTKGSQPQNSSETAQPSPPAQKEGEPLAQAPPPTKASTRKKKPPMSMAEMSALSEQSMADIGPKSSATLAAEGSAKQEGSPSADGKQTEGQEAGPMGRSMNMVPIPPIPSMNGDEPVKRNRNRVPEVGNIKQPEFFKPFDNFPTRLPRKHKLRVLSHDALVKPSG